MQFNFMVSRPVHYLLFGIVLLAGCGGGSGGAAAINNVPTPAIIAPIPTASSDVVNNAVALAQSISAPVSAPVITPTVVTTPLPPPPPVVANTVNVAKIEFAQTHILPEGGLTWTLYNLAVSTTIPSASRHLSLVGGRNTLVLVTFGNVVTSPLLEAWQAGVKLGSVTLNAPLICGAGAVAGSCIPSTEDNGAAYSTTAWTAILPAAWVTPSVSLRVSGNDALGAAMLSSSAHPLDVGADSDMNLKIVPFHLFGATAANVNPAVTTDALPDATTQAEILTKWPVKSLNVSTHPIAAMNGGAINLPYIVVGPRSNNAGVTQPAYVLTSMEQQSIHGDTWAVMAATLGIIHQIRAANGESSTNNQYYGPIITRKNVATVPVTAFLGGGLGGGSAGVGDELYQGVFIHEQGHAYGIGHSGTDYAAGHYPYPGGSLSSSAWGYDVNHNQFLSPYVPTSANSFATCLASTTRQPPVGGKCIKQDPMQGGAGDQAAGYKYALFSDYNTAWMQAWFEGKTTLSGTTHVFSGGVIYEDATSPTGYSHWDSIAKQRATYTPSTKQLGLYGMNDGLPMTGGVNVPVHSIIITYSNAGTHANNVAAGISQIYPTLAYTGNLVQMFDPSNATDLVDFKPGSGKNQWYCQSVGCDYTVRVTYSDNSVIYRALQGGFRPWFGPTAAMPTATTDPLNSGSFKTWVINVPGRNAAGSTVALSKVELLDTPMVWNLTAATITTSLAAAPVLLTR